MSSSLEIFTLSKSEHDAAARLLHQSLFQWYETRLGQGARFGNSHEPFLLFPEVYAALDPGECVAARDSVSGQLLGVCFSHERDTHVSVGIVATAPEAAGRGVARRMVEAVLDKAKSLGKPARLVSSLLNLDSFSLYTRLGFVPGVIFQDLMLTVPDAGMTAPAPSGVGRVRLARPDEAEAIADLEQSLQGIRREKDYAFFLRNEVGSWRVMVQERDDGSLEGALAMSIHPSFNMIGPGVASTEESAAALLWAALNSVPGKTMVFLVPCAASHLVKTAYGWGARNVELHVAQSTQPSAAGRGVVFPTFLPESA